MGGDEIVILSPSMSIKCPSLIIQSIEHELKEISQQIKVDVSVSIGIALYPDDGKIFEELIKKADRNMYQFKFSKMNFDKQVN